MNNGHEKPGIEVNCCSAYTKTKQIKDSDEISEVSDISEFSDENETIEDIDTPSYLRKGSNQ